MVCMYVSVHVGMCVGCVCGECGYDYVGMYVCGVCMRVGGVYVCVRGGVYVGVYVCVWEKYMCVFMWVCI